MERFYQWRVRIQDARDQRAVAHVIQDYRLALPPALVESLPGGCREAIDTKDIPDAALALLQAEMKYRGEPDVAAALHEIAHTYAAAAVKLADRRSLGR